MIQETQDLNRNFPGNPGGTPKLSPWQLRIYGRVIPQVTVAGGSSIR